MALRGGRDSVHSDDASVLCFFFFFLVNSCRLESGYRRARTSEIPILYFERYWTGRFWNCMVFFSVLFGAGLEVGRTDGRTVRRAGILRGVGS